jgi:hypothetical protein
MILTLGLGACSNPFSKSSDEPLMQGQQGRTIWESNLEYVKIVDKDVPGVANDHPASISQETMREVLGYLYASRRILMSDKQMPLFAASELSVLSQALSSGLSQAGSDEDVNFVTIGMHRATLTKEPATNTGRVFMSNGRLNIIFGMLQEEYRDKDRATGQQIDRRLNPLLPGTRKSAATLSGQVVLDKGISFHIDADTGSERTDWVEIDIPTVLAAIAERKGEDSNQLSPELRETIARNKQETANLRKDVSNLKEILFDMSGQIEELKKQLESKNAAQ